MCDQGREPVEKTQVPLEVGLATSSDEFTLWMESVPSAQACWPRGQVPLEGGKRLTAKSLNVLPKWGLEDGVELPIPGAGAGQAFVGVHQASGGTEQKGPPREGGRG